jgi:hypothetical protein
MCSYKAYNKPYSVSKCKQLQQVRTRNVPSRLRAQATVFETQASKNSETKYTEQSQEKTSCTGCKEKVYCLPCGLGPGRQPGWVFASKSRNGRRSGQTRGRAERDKSRCHRHRSLDSVPPPPLTPNPRSARHSETTSAT